MRSEGLFYIHFISGDGNLDLAITINGPVDDYVALIRGDGAGWLLNPHLPNIPVDTEPIAIVTGDFNGDGVPDIATANEGVTTVSVALGKGDGAFSTSVSIQVGVSPVALVAADFR